MNYIKLTLKIATSIIRIMKYSVLLVKSRGEALPLPLYWDELVKLDWELLAEGIGFKPQRDSLQIETTLEFRTECLNYLRLREIAEWSNAHEALLIGFLESGYGGEVPSRPKWLFA